MSKKVTSDTHFTIQVKNLINKIYGRSILKDSLLERAVDFYENQPFNQNKLDKLNQRIAELSVEKSDEKVQQKIDKLERECRDFKQELTFERNERYKHLYAICKEIIELTEGANFDEVNRKSAQLLGTIQLLSPTQGKKVAQVNERSKPLYKAVLTLRLLDKLSIDGLNITSDTYAGELLEGIEGDHYKQLKAIDNENYTALIESVKIPLLMASLIQDIGHFHPDAQRLVKGEDGTLDPHRTLEVEDRKRLLQINYSETIKFLVDGVGAPTYIGNSKKDRDRFNIEEHKKLVFIKHLLKSAISPKNGIGNLLKVPQIYTSIILSTKASYNYKLLPKVYQALNQNAERGTCRQDVVDALRAITGDFPQGYGITYIPTDNDGKEGDHYEYAIVNQFYPDCPTQPKCRMATRKLAFISHGLDIDIPTSVNLYNTETAQRFSSVSKDRLNEILELLSSNYHERKALDLLPRCWHADDFFSMKDNQKLWNKTTAN